MKTWSVRYEVRKGNAWRKGLNVFTHNYSEAQELKRMADANPRFRNFRIVPKGKRE
jgi:hypothetical protein